MTHAWISIPPFVYLFYLLYNKVHCKPCALFIMPNSIHIFGESIHQVPNAIITAPSLINIVNIYTVENKQKTIFCSYSL